MTEESTELAPVFGAGLMDVGEGAALVAAMDETADEGGRGDADISYMSFSGKMGQYSIGVDKREPGEDEHFLVAVPSFMLGYICWKGGKPEAKRMAKITQPKITAPDPEEFGPFNERVGEGWYRARAITVRSFENGEQCEFTNNSKSGVANMSDLQREVNARMKTGQPSWPVVTFSKSQFMGQGQKNWKPDINIKGWLSTEDVKAMADPDVDPMSLMNGDKPDPAGAPEPKRRKL